MYMMWFGQTRSLTSNFSSFTLPHFVLPTRVLCCFWMLLFNSLLHLVLAVCAWASVHLPQPGAPLRGHSPEENRLSLCLPQSSVANSSSDRGGVSRAPLPSILGCCLVWSSRGLEHLVPYIVSSCVQLHCQFQQILFDGWCLLPLVLAISHPHPRSQRPSLITEEPVEWDNTFNLDVYNGAHLASYLKYQLSSKFHLCAHVPVECVCVCAVCRWKKSQVIYLPLNLITKNCRHEYARKFECVFVSNRIFGKGGN